ncbi:MAG: hypothetical protein HETSPECPRED_005715 [Heterodermia speciosa]|uniref:F-box domain-containing protein n=1 Tax=Heterodermia speciosa TaxID=116794 RepID=A0A8H3IRS0_9LECA|nr:MAG: hypothetical protein HETSPECPRED_005715 [Heterodermia speciosa]
MPIHLFDLPLEILYAVTKELNPRELRSLRLVCRALDPIAFDLFGPRDFARIETDLKPTLLRRLDGISKAVHINHCVKHLSIVSSRNLSEDRLPDPETEDIVQAICRGNPLLNLQTLSLGLTGMTPRILRDLLFSSSGSLQTLHLEGTMLEKGGKWTRVFASMIGNFPRLRSVVVDNLYEFGDPCNGTPLGFPGLVEYDIVPGSQEVHRYIRSHYTDKRRLKMLLHPVEIHIIKTDWTKTDWHSLGDCVYKVGYSGADIDEFLDVLVDTADTR